MTQQMTLKVGLSDHACFENFFVGDNAEAVHAIHDLAAGDSKQVLVYGEPGCGKTHLLYAGLKAALSAGRRATYLSMSDETVLGRLEGFEDPGTLVCVDDVDHPAGEERFEHIVFNLVESLRQTRTGMLLACEKPPSKCGFVLGDLVSRLNSGASYRLSPLSDDAKAAAMRLRAGQRGFHLPDDVIAYVMKRYPRDTSALFALLDRIDRSSLSEQRKVTIPFVRKLDG